MTKNNTEDNSVSQESSGNPVDYVNDDQANLADPTGPDEEVGAVEEVNEGDESPAEVEEVADDSEQIAKRIDSLKDAIETILSKSSAETAEKIEALEKTVRETRSLLDKKFEELDTKYATLNTDLETAKSRQVELENSLSKINSSGAFRKSADSDDSVETVQSETTWNGAFSVNNLFN